MAKAEKRIARLKGAYDHLATRTDIERLRSELEEDTERLKSEVKVDIESLRAELRGVKWFIGAGKRGGGYRNSRTQPAARDLILPW